MIFGCGDETKNLLNCGWCAMGTPLTTRSLIQEKPMLFIKKTFWTACYKLLYGLFF